MLTEPCSEAVEFQIERGRYKDFSAAVQDAIWHAFVARGSPFDEYGVKPEEVEASAQKDLHAIRAARRAGKLKPWQP